MIPSPSGRGEETGGAPSNIMPDGAEGDDDSALEGVDQLFVCKEYRPVSLQIGDSIAVDVLASPQASTDYDLTGQVLWPVSVLLAHYLVSQLQGSDIQGKTTVVIELGAGGTAVPSMAAAQCDGVDRVVATDGNDHEVFDLLQLNVRRFRELHEGTPSAARLCDPLPCLWGHRDHFQQLLRLVPDEAHLLVVAADVVQWPAMVEPLLHTVKALLWPASPSGSLRGRMLLGIVNRANQTYMQFWESARRLGFEATRVDSLERLFPDGRVPRECREAGGRQTELHELVLERLDDTPVLLQVGGGDSTDPHHLSSGSVALPC